MRFNMMPLRLPLLFLALSPLFFSSTCKQDVPKPDDTEITCYLKTTLLDGREGYTYARNSYNQLETISLGAGETISFDYAGAEATKYTYKSNGIVFTTEDYQYAGGKPSVRIISIGDGAGNLVPSEKHEYRYKGTNPDRPDRMTFFYYEASQWVDRGYENLEWDSRGNLKQVQRFDRNNTFSWTLATVTTYTYDDKPHALTAFRAAFPFQFYVNNELSKKTVDDKGQSTGEESASTYTYNAEGLPITRTITMPGQGSEMLSYSYECK